MGVFRTPFCLLTQTQTHTLSPLVINHSASLPCNAQLKGSYTCTYCTSEHSDIWKCEKSLTVTPLSWVLVIFLPLCSYVWMHSIGSRSHWNMLLHSERVNELCYRQSSGEFIWWRAPLDLFVAPKRLTTRKLPLFCSDKWFWWEGGRRKSVCVRPRQRLWGF